MCPGHHSNTGPHISGVGGVLRLLTVAENVDTPNGWSPVLLLNDSLKGVGLIFSISSFWYTFIFTAKSMQDTEK